MTVSYNLETLKSQSCSCKKEGSILSTVWNHLLTLLESRISTRSYDLPTNDLCVHKIILVCSLYSIPVSSLTPPFTPAFPNQYKWFFANVCVAAKNFRTSYPLSASNYLFPCWISECVRVYIHVYEVYPRVINYLCALPGTQDFWNTFQKFSKKICEQRKTAAAAAEALELAQFKSNKFVLPTPDPFPLLLILPAKQQPPWLPSLTTFFLLWWLVCVSYTPVPPSRLLSIIYHFGCLYFSPRTVNKISS